MKRSSILLLLLVLGTGTTAAQLVGGRLHDRNTGDLIPQFVKLSTHEDRTHPNANIIRPLRQPMNPEEEIQFAGLQQKLWDRLAVPVYKEGKRRISAGEEAIAVTEAEACFEAAHRSRQTDHGRKSLEYWRGLRTRLEAFSNDPSRPDTLAPAFESMSLVPMGYLGPRYMEVALDVLEEIENTVKPRKRPPGPDIGYFFKAAMLEGMFRSAPEDRPGRRPAIRERVEREMRRHWNNENLDFAMRQNSVISGARCWYDNGEPGRGMAILDEYERKWGKEKLSSAFLNMQFCIALFGLGDRPRAHAIFEGMKQRVREGLLAEEDGELAKVQENYYAMISVNDTQLKIRARQYIARMKAEWAWKGYEP